MIYFILMPTIASCPNLGIMTVGGVGEGWKIFTQPLQLSIAVRVIYVDCRVCIRRVAEGGEFN